MTININTLLIPALLLTACGTGSIKQPKPIDPNITRAMTNVKVEDFTSSNGKGATLSANLRSALKYGGITLASDGRKAAVLRGKLTIDPFQTHCANSTNPKISVYVCDRSGYVTVNYRLFDKQGKILLTERVTSGILESEMSNTSSAEATANLKSEDKLLHDALQEVTQKIVRELSLK